MPIRFGGVPIGVPIPPIDAPNAVISIIVGRESRLAGASAFRRPVRCARSRARSGNIIAVVAVLLIHIEMPATTPP